jgi:hypothetical protein
VSFETVAVLPTGTTMSPLLPVGATYYDVAQTAYVLFKLNEARTRPTRVMTSFGNITHWKLGTEIVLEHDQTQVVLGRYRIDGIHHFASGERAGEVPNLKLKHCVVK